MLVFSRTALGLVTFISSESQRKLPHSFSPLLGPPHATRSAIESGVLFVSSSLQKKKSACCVHAAMTEKLCAGEARQGMCRFWLHSLAAVAAVAGFSRRRSTSTSASRLKPPLPAA